MQNIAKKLAVSTFLMAVITSTSASAAQEPYAGVAVTHWNYSEDDILDIGDFKSFSGSIRVGSRFNQYVAVESHLTLGGNDKKAPVEMS